MTRLQSHSSIQILAVAMLLATGTTPASAAEVRFLDVTDPNPVVVLHAGFDCGASYTVSGESAHFTGCWSTSEPAGSSGAAHAIMVEPFYDINPFTSSDSIFIQWNVSAGAGGQNQATISIDFHSWPTGHPHYATPSGFPVIEETGTLQLLNPYFVSFPSPAAPYTLLAPPGDLLIQAQSDAGSATPTKPSTWGRVKTFYR